MTRREHMSSRHEWKDVSVLGRMRSFVLLCVCIQVCVCVCEYFCISVCFTEREAAAAEARGPPGSTRRQPQLDASRGGQDVLTAS